MCGNEIDGIQTAVSAIGRLLARIKILMHSCRMITFLIHLSVTQGVDGRQCSFVQIYLESIRTTNMCYRYIRANNRIELHLLLSSLFAKVEIAGGCDAVPHFNNRSNYRWTARYLSSVFNWKTLQCPIRGRVQISIPYYEENALDIGLSRVVMLYVIMPYQREMSKYDFQFESRFMYTILISLFRPLYTHIFISTIKMNGNKWQYHMHMALSHWHKNTTFFDIRNGITTSNLWTLPVFCCLAVHNAVELSGHPVRGMYAK